MAGRRHVLFGSVRARMTVLATLVAVIAVGISAVALLVVLRHSLERAGDDAAKTRAEDLAALATTGTLPRLLTVPNDEDVAQVVDASGAVLAGSTGHTGRAIATFAPEGRAPVVRMVRDVPDDNELIDFRVWAQRARTPDGPVTVYVGTSLESVNETIATVRRVLLLILPPLLALLAVASWVLVGRALRPVEAIRAEVADISGRALDRRVPVPPRRDEIGRLASTMNEMLDRLQAASERQRKFVADASHELQSPIAALRTQLEVAIAQPATTDWAATSSDLLAESRHMERLVRDLLFLARSDGEEGVRRIEPVDLDDIVLEEATRLRSTAQVRVDASGVSAAPLTGNRDELTRLVRNLLENAEHHAESRVRIRLSAEGREIILMVEDDGPGVPPAERERIFQRFTRLDEARSRNNGGTGLGLAIVKEITERHGGTVCVENAAPGARFAVRLPQMQVPHR
ncbi:MAG TPA: HAMP domain-containing sensor histidine kinase [Actinomycetes bacterium]